MKQKRPGRGATKPDSEAAAGAPFLQLDYLYVPSSDVAKDLVWTGRMVSGEEAVALNVAQQSLVEVMVRIDEARQHDGVRRMAQLACDELAQWLRELLHR